jgi:hypothetical protein
MSRWASIYNEAAADVDGLRGCHLLDLSFSSGHVFVTDAGIDMSFGGNTYVAVGGLGSFDGIEESVDFVARGCRMELGGIEPTLIATIISESDTYQGRPATLYVGMLDEQNAFIDTPEILWAGYMDTMKISMNRTDDVVAAKIILTCEHRLRNTPPYSRWSDADQQERYQSPSRDRFFQYTAVAAGYKSNWGGRLTTWNYRPGGGYTPG